MLVTQGVPRLWIFVAGNVGINEVSPYFQPNVAVAPGLALQLRGAYHCISVPPFFVVFLSPWLHDFAWQSIISSYMIYMVKKYRLHCSNWFLPTSSYLSYLALKISISFIICISYVLWCFYREISRTEVYSLHLARSPRRPRRTQLAYVGRGMKRWAHWSSRWMFFLLIASLMASLIIDSCDLMCNTCHQYSSIRFSVFCECWSNKINKR